MHPLRFLPAAGTALLLAACAGTGTGTQMAADAWHEDGSVPAFEAAGRLSVKENERGSYAHFGWLRTEHLQLFEIKTPLGNSFGHLCADGRGAQIVTADGQSRHAAGIDELSRQLLGYDLPVAHIDRWANGLRVAGAPYQTTSDGQLQQLGWRIERTLGDNGQVRMLLLERPGLSLRLIFDHIGPPENPPAACPQTEAS